MRRRKNIEGISIAFLDVIACGFGAVILMLILTKVFEPIIIEETAVELEGVLEEKERQLYDIRGETSILNREMISREDQLSVARRRLARLQAELSKIQGQFAASSQDAEVNNIIQGKLAAAQQSLTAEMRRLLAQFNEIKDNNMIGGIPVDSEYIIFIIDTSGSMYNYAWPLMLEKVRETLDVYPQVKGIQVMNDMGQFMFSRYVGKWIPDTPGRRNAIIERLRTWNAFSNSSPVEGITKAISTFYAPDKKISLYVMGDEFTGRSIDTVLRTIRAINREGKDGKRLVRIHAIGFPTQFIRPERMQVTGIRFATLMRLMCAQNGGTFVALPFTRT
ncbi:MAG: VWA domain-containing protein [Proteobacteria bacterium]|nr:VWA domain-containing protein [Pseudomonadota bacterium]